MAKIKVSEYALAAQIQAINRIGQKEIPVKYSRLYSAFMRKQKAENEALALAQKLLKNKLVDASEEEKLLIEKEFEDYLATEVEVDLLPHDFLKHITAVSPCDLFHLERFIESVED